jgi:hypothetical protein
LFRDWKVTRTEAEHLSVKRLEVNWAEIVTATDSAGKATINTIKVTLDTVAPVISAVSIIPNPVDAGQTYIISVTVTD